MIKGAYILIDKTLVIGELWEVSGFGRDLKLLSVDHEHQLISRLMDQVDILRKLGFPVFSKYTIYPKYVIKTFVGKVSYHFLRHDMFKKKQRKGGYMEEEYMVTQEILAATKNPE